MNSIRIFFLSQKIQLKQSAWTIISLKCRTELEWNCVIAVRTEFLTFTLSIKSTTFNNNLFRRVAHIYKQRGGAPQKRGRRGEVGGGSAPRRYHRTAVGRQGPSPATFSTVQLFFGFFRETRSAAPTDVPLKRPLSCRAESDEESQLSCCLQLLSPRDKAKSPYNTERTQTSAGTYVV